MVAEGHAWFLRRYDRSRALQFMALIEALKPLKVAPCGVAERKAAVAVLRRFADQDLTVKPRRRWAHRGHATPRVPLTLC